MKRFKNLKLAISFAKKSSKHKWIFENEDGDGYVAVTASWAQDLMDSGLSPIRGPIDLC